MEKGSCIPPECGEVCKLGSCRRMKFGWEQEVALMVSKRGREAGDDAKGENGATDPVASK